MNARRMALPLAVLLLGWGLGWGCSTSSDEAKQFEEIKAKAERGDARAQFNVGMCYAEGKGVPPDHAEAARWYRKAADQGNVIAQYSLGLCYERGKGVPQDNTEAAKWFRKAADQGYAVAQHDLGACYAKGHGVPQDYVEAYKWILLAVAQQSFEPAKRSMTVLERELTQEQRAEGQKRASTFKPSRVTSLEAEQNAVARKELADLRAKAQKGDAKVQNELGEALYAGRPGVPKNPVEAVQWFRIAAEQYFAPAQSNLGVCCERGEGVAKYEVEAYKWDLLAAAQGDTKGKQNASALELMLSKEELAEGKRRADDWLERRKRSPGDNR